MQHEMTAAQQRFALLRIEILDHLLERWPELATSECEGRLNRAIGELANALHPFLHLRPKD